MFWCYAMRSSGLYLSLEAIFSLIILISLLVIPTQLREQNLDELYIMQKQNDLLKIWVRERNFEEANLKSDFLFVFPNQKGLIEFGNKKIVIGKLEGLNNYRKSVAIGHYLDGELELREIKLTVYY